MGTALYMMALMPPAGLAADIRTIQEEFAVSYSCRAGLKNPPHITLVPPFQASKDDEANVIARIRINADPFQVHLPGFSSFSRNRVIFIDVDRSPALVKLQAELQKSIKQLLPEVTFRSSGTFNPHITVGYRDIPPMVFPEAEKSYLHRRYSAGFLAEKVCFWRHNRQQWEVIHEFPITRNMERQLNLFGS